MALPTTGIRHPDFAGSSADVHAPGAFSRSSGSAPPVDPGWQWGMIEDLDPAVSCVGYVEPIVRVSRDMVR